MSVLVVDDIPLNRVILGTVLRSLNLHVIEAEDGHAGLQAYLQAGRSVAMVFMDIMMPVCGGIQAALSIRSAESRHGWLPVPIVAYTSEDVAQGSALWHECMSSGFNDVVSKPVNKRFAQQLLCRWMPGLQERCAQALGASSGGGSTASTASSDDELAASCGSGSGKCGGSSSSGGSRGYTPGAAASCAAAQQCEGPGSRSRDATASSALAKEAPSLRS